MPLLETRTLTKRFGGLAAVSELDIAVDDGLIVGLIGPNGAGKTTAFNLISGMLPATKGQVIFRGKDVTGLKAHERAKMGLARTFQITNLFSNMTVLQNVILGCYLQDKTGMIGDLLGGSAFFKADGGNSAKYLGILDFMGLRHIADELAKNLPHGYQRCLSLAIALATNPKLLMLDEPMSGMSVEEAGQMVTAVQRLRDAGITVLVIEHNMRALMSVSQHVVVLNQGRKIAEGSPAQVSQNANVIKAYLGDEVSVAEGN